MLLPDLAGPVDEEGAAGEDGEPDVLHVLHHHEPHRHRLLSPPETVVLDKFSTQNHAISRGFYPLCTQDFPKDSAFFYILTKNHAISRGFYPVCTQGFHPKDSAFL